MSKHILSMSVALFAATGLISAQPAPSQAQPANAQPAYEEQIVTVEGCLRRERAPGDAALEVSADPESDVMFMLANAELRSRTDTRPTAEPPTGDSALGPAGRQNERAGLPGDGRSTAESGEPDGRIRGTTLDGAPTPAAGTYVVVGLEGDRLRLFAGQRVEMDGQFDQPAASITRDGAEAAPVGTSGTALTLPRFRATSIKPVPGVCTPKP